MANDLSVAAPKDDLKLSFGAEIDLFTKHIDAICHVLVGMVVAVQEATKRAQEELIKFEGKTCEVVEDKEGRTVNIPSTHYREWKRKARKFEHFQLSRSLLPRSLLVSLISQYDAYLGRILRTVFVRKPGILNGSEKKISFEALSQFSSIDAAREYILEKEVEAILRSSHAEQFKWMEKSFDLVLTKDLPSWSTFMEITERRNLFVHTDGIVSSQYVAVCKLHKCLADDSPKEGERLGVPQAYFESAHRCIYEIGVKLGHVLWRKLFPDERQAADANYVRLTYDLIENGKYELAICLLDFACNEFKIFSDEGNQLTLIVNRAQAYKWKGDEERCKKIMRATDWSAKGDQFRLADAVLAEDWPRAAKVMKRIGNDGPVDATAYRDWPLFRDLRKQDIFLNSFIEIFGEPFASKSEVKMKELTAPQQGSGAVEQVAEPDSDAL